MKKLYFQLRQKLFLNALTHAIPGAVKPFVLCYHQIDAKEFEEQIVSLARRFKIVDLETFIHKLNEGQLGNYCALTLDDCLKKDVEKAVPVCRKHNIPITLFLPVRFSGEKKALPGTKVQRFLEEKREFVLQKREYHVTAKNFSEVRKNVHSFFDPGRFKIEAFDNAVGDWFAENNVSEMEIVKDEDKVIGLDEVRKLSAVRNIDFQSHTYNHETLGLCSRDEIEFELRESRRVLEQVTGKRVNALCYPYGSKEVIGENVLDLVSAHYSSAFTLLQDVCTKRTDRYFIPRIGIYPGDALNAFWGKIYHHMQTAFFK